MWIVVVCDTEGLVKIKLKTAKRNNVIGGNAGGKSSLIPFLVLR